MRKLRGAAARDAVEPAAGTSGSATVPAPTGVRWLTFGVISVAYLAVTVGESVLAPVFPLVADDFGVADGTAGVAFGVLAASIAVANIAGGYLLARRGSRAGLVAALICTGAGSVVGATAANLGVFLVAQVLLGVGAGLFFAPGINAVGLIAGASRRGLAMGLFGVAFSGGLSLAALLGVLGDRAGWRLAFVVGAVFAAVGLAAVAMIELPPRRTTPVGGKRLPLRAALGTAAGVGSAAACAQYGTVSFVPLFAVDVWDMSPGSAALVLVVARMLSVPAKTIAGHAADRGGATITVRRLGLLLGATGLGWTLVPVTAVAIAGVIVFAASVSAVFPIANMLALAEFGERGPLLGTFRSVQMGVGALMAGTIGLGAATIGLRATLALTIAVPATLTLVGRRR